jgi:transcription termination factor Rho
VIEVDARNVGRLRDPENHFAETPRDAYVLPAAVLMNGLRSGMLVTGKAAIDDQGRPVLVEVSDVDGMDVEAARAIPELRRQTSIDPSDRFVLEDGNGDLTLRVIDLVAPLGKGQRCLVVAPPRSGKTVMLEKIAERISEGYKDTELLVLLVNERPEEATHFKRLIKRGRVYVSTADEPNRRHVHICEMVGARARRLAELGKDVFLIVDSLTRIGRAYNAETSGGGRTLSGGPRSWRRP